MGLLYENQALRQIGDFYANKLLEENIKPKHLFGPAYKGISLATATAIALAEREISTLITFNRKEVKDHGEKGQLIGAPIDDVNDIIMIDDVITAGTAFRETQHLIKEEGGRLSTVIIALDRCEPGMHGQSAISDIESEGIQVLSLITVYDIIAYLKKTKHCDEALILEGYVKKEGAIQR